MYNSYYVEGIGNLYEFDCGSESGWMYKVNGWFPNYGCSSYTLSDGDVIVWCYTCNGRGGWCRRRNGLTVMDRDPFSRCHPAVQFLFFLGAIGFGVVIQHPAYLLAGWVAAAGYYLLLHGPGGWRQVIMWLPVFVALTVLNPLFNPRGEHVLFTIFGRPLHRGRPSPMVGSLPECLW